ncbi:MAG: Gfo/Idh/MocA family oxidoreductase [Clostridiales bacterium]|nr:Gfo/Idh/MocA family oxidoreductase [Clostridiales bacterium]
MIKVGIIGCGKIAQVRHLPEYAHNPDVQLVGYYDKNVDRAEAIAKQYGGIAYASYFDLLKNPEIDAVSVCVENRNHAEISNAALYAGKHVLCEKPMAVTLQECESMVAAAERNGKYLMIGHNMRLNPVHRRAKELLDAGIIGDVITFRTILGNAGPEGWSVDAGTWFFDKNKAAMGALSDLGIHKVDLMQYLTGQKVVETTAKVITLNKHDDEGGFIGVDDNALCILRMSGGAVGTLAASWTVYGKECKSTCLYGTKGIMRIFDDAQHNIVVIDANHNITSYDIDYDESTSGVIDAFVEALENNHEPEISGREALYTMRAIFASIKSSETSRTVSVNESFISHF